FFLAIGLTYTPLPDRFKPFIVFCAWLGFFISAVGWVAANRVHRWPLKYRMLSTVLAALASGLIVGAAWWLLVARAEFTAGVPLTPTADVMLPIETLPVEAKKPEAHPPESPSGQKVKSSRLSQRTTGDNSPAITTG